MASALTFCYREGGGLLCFFYGPYTTASEWRFIMCAWNSEVRASLRGSATCPTAHINSGCASHVLTRTHVTHTSRCCFGALTYSRHSTKACCGRVWSPLSNHVPIILSLFGLALCVHVPRVSQCRLVDMSTKSQFLCMGRLRVVISKPKLYFVPFPLSWSKISTTAIRAPN